MGSVHDARVFGNSDVGHHLADFIPTNYHLLGDCAYPLKVNLMTPFRDNDHLTRRQVTYNTKLSKTRCTVERAFGLLKGRFRRLKFLAMYRTDLVPTIVMACCVLHNIAQETQDDDDIVLHFEDPDTDDDEESDAPTPVAVGKRLEIMNLL